MFKYTDTKESPWRVVPLMIKKGEIKLFVIFFHQYRTISKKSITLPDRQAEGGYSRPSITGQTFVKRPLLAQFYQKSKLHYC